MRLRSLLFVPGDRPDRMEKALKAGADALILDLEDAVAPAAKPDARRAVAAFLHANATAPQAQASELRLAAPKLQARKHMSLGDYSARMREAGQ